MNLELNAKIDEEIETMNGSKTSDQELVLAVARAKGRNRSSANKRNGWERELWTAYLHDGPARSPGASEPPTDPT